MKKRHMKKFCRFIYCYSNDCLFFFRAKNAVKVLCTNQLEDQAQLLDCIGIDSRIDKETLTLETVSHEGGIALKRSIKEEHHLTFTAESGVHGGRYLCHKTLPNGTAEAMANETISVLEESNSISTISGLLVDNTSANVGCNKGLVVKIEEKIGRKLHTIGCSLHQNELPLRSLFKHLDGTTSGPKKFSGQLGKLCTGESSFLEPQIKFKKIPNDVASFKMTEYAAKDLSSDQEILYHYCVGIAAGKVDSPWIHRKIGPVNHARWLTLAIRLLGLYVRTTKPHLNLVKLTNYIVTVYAPSWFSIKMSYLKDIPLILHHSFTRIRQIPFEDVRNVVLDSYSRNSYALLPENFVYSMICADDKEITKKGWEIVVNCRSTEVTSERKKIPPINWTAESWIDLIDRSKIICEPPTTKKFSIDQILDFIAKECFPKLPMFPAHSQSVERAVKEVTRASKLVYSEDHRHGTVLGTIVSRELRPSFENKCAYHFSSMND